MNASSTTASSMAVRPSSRNCGLKPVVRASPSISAWSDSEAWASSPDPASRVSWPSPNASCTAVLRSATSATRFTESTRSALSILAVVRCSPGKRLRTLGNSPSSSRVVVRRTPPGPTPSKPMMPSPVPLAASAIVTSPPPVSDLAVSPRTLAGTSAAMDASGVRGLQSSSTWLSRNRSVASSEMVEPSISIRTPVSTGQHVVATGGGHRLGDGVREVVARDGAGRRRHVGQRRVVLDRHRLQAEARRAAGQRDPWPLEHHLDRLGGQAAADVGEQPAADQRLALVGDLGLGQRGAGRGLVVEGREHQALVTGLDQQAGEHRDARTDREAAGSPGDGIGEDVAFDTELHGAWSFRSSVSGGVVHPATTGGSRAEVSVGGAELTRSRRPQIGVRVEFHRGSIRDRFS